MKIIKNFLSLNHLKTIQNDITSNNFAWHLKHKMTPEDKNLYFSHSYFHQNQINSDLYFNHILPILKELNCKAIIEARSNLFLSKTFEKSEWHYDYDFDSYTAILYLNTCDGGTEFKIKNKINFVKAIENQIVIFDTKTYHRVCTSTNSDKRYIINLNYF